MPSGLIRGILLRQRAQGANLLNLKRSHSRRQKIGQKVATLFVGSAQICRGTPGMKRERGEIAHRVDASHGLGRRQCSGRDRTQCRAAMGTL